MRAIFYEYCLSICYDLFANLSDHSCVHANFTYEAVKVGDYVEQAIVDAAMDCVPPACMRADCSQMGEPYSARMDEKTGRWRDTYETFRKVGGEWPNGIWEYCGHCFRGETVERGIEPYHI